MIFTALIAVVLTAVYTLLDLFNLFDHLSLQFFILLRLSLFELSLLLCQECLLLLYIPGVFIIRSFSGCILFFVKLLSLSLFPEIVSLQSCLLHSKKQRRKWRIPDMNDPWKCSEDPSQNIHEKSKVMMMGRMDCLLVFVNLFFFLLLKKTGRKLHVRHA